MDCIMQSYFLMSQEDPNANTKVIWETRETKDEWRQRAGSVSAEDFEKIVKEMAAEVHFLKSSDSESICAI